MEQRETLEQRIDAAASYIRAHAHDPQPELLLVLGSGLNHIAESIADAATLPFADVPFLREATLDEHVGQFVFGSLGGKRVMAMQGRLHGYEGYAPQEVAFPVWVAHKLGAGALLTTNAAGSLTSDLVAGDFVVVSDHINFTGRNPVAEDGSGTLEPRFFSMEDAYDARLRETALQVGAELGIRIQEGVYLEVLGPSFETPAEIRAFATLGATTVAMSMCEEVIAARQMGMRVLGLNLVCNQAAGVGSKPVGDVGLEEELVGVLSCAAENATRLIKGIVGAMELT